MNVRRIPALFAMLFAASACSPSLDMLEYAPQVPVNAYVVGTDGSTDHSEPLSSVPAVEQTYQGSTGGPGQPAAPPVSVPTNVDSAGAQLSSTAVGAGSEQSVTP